MATETDKVNTGALGTLIAVGLGATLSIALAVTALVRYSVQGVSDGRQQLARQGYLDLRGEQTGRLAAAPAWKDKGKGVVSEPIDRAKRQVLADLQRDPTTASGPAPAVSASAAPADSSASPAASGATPSAPHPAAPKPQPAGSKPTNG
jgi:hypothetical protein